MSVLEVWIAVCFPCQINEVSCWSELLPYYVAISMILAMRISHLRYYTVCDLYDIRHLDSRYLFDILSNFNCLYKTTTYCDDYYVVFYHFRWTKNCEETHAFKYSVKCRKAYIYILISRPNSQLVLISVVRFDCKQTSSTIGYCTVAR